MVVVKAGSTTALNQTLELAGTIAGTVTASATKAAVQGVTVRVFQAVNVSIERRVWNQEHPGGVVSETGVLVGEATTNASGEYAVTGLSGAYVVNFAPPASANLLPVYSGGQTSIVQAERVVATAGETTTLNAALLAGGRITGTVTNVSKTPLADVTVTASSTQGTGVAFATPYNAGDSLPWLAATTVTNAEGEYVLEGLATGDYVVSFSSSAYFSA
jgi:hypothetical protein